MSDYAGKNDNDNIAQWVLSGLNTLGIVGEGIGFSVWIAAVSS